MARAPSPQREMEATSQVPESLPSTPARYSLAPSFTSEPQVTPDGEWRDKLPNLLTKSDFEALSDRLGRVVREEVAQLRSDLSNVEARMTVAEAETKALWTDLEHTISVVTGQEADMAQLTTWVDDLDNRSRRLNLRVRGVREGGPCNHQDRNNHADPTTALKGPSTNANTAGTKTKRGGNNKQKKHHTARATVGGRTDHRQSKTNSE
ncbi:Hypothetical predicted protein [Pelobates cultripes]|uniref:Uncharacterized protein n=1 Tax=Pelobates cultripes TaxID=61616 RepID=A0AAD1T6D3_PELCU|nr:Hypothetical predicted protein [Pelobates cultripes]